jgi:hypothetical protein
VGYVFVSVCLSLYYSMELGGTHISSMYKVEFLPLTPTLHLQLTYVWLRMRGQLQMVAMGVRCPWMWPCLKCKSCLPAAKVGRTVLTDHVSSAQCVRWLWVGSQGATSF